MPVPRASSYSPLLDTPSLSPSCSTPASRSSIASSNSSISLGDLGSRMSKAHFRNRGSYDVTQPVDPQDSSRKFAHDSTMFSGGRENDIEEELDSEVCPDQHDRTSRPNIPRQGSYSKRHSSFDTPREVPFPCGYLTSPVPSLRPQHERSTSVPTGLQADPGHPSTNRMDIEDDSRDGNVKDASESFRPNFERLSTMSLPLPTFTPFDVLPALFTPPSHSNDVGVTPLIRKSPLSSTESGLEPPIDSSPCTTSHKPTHAEFRSAHLSSLSVPQPSRLHDRMSPESPLLIADEPDAADLTRPHGSPQPSLSDPPSHHDTRPHNSLPPPPKVSSFPFTSAPLPRTMSHPIGGGSLDSQMQSHSGGSHFPPPQPPTVLTPPPPLSADQGTRTPAPYEPFLPREQPPPSHTYIAVETLTSEYRLIVRLPGFQRDSITLSMRRRRILHIVADNWSDDGGHFERRISFGYDADLASVRAEFDGEILRVIVPRKAPPGWYNQPW